MGYIRRRTPTPPSRRHLPRVPARRPSRPPHDLPGGHVAWMPTYSARPPADAEAVITVERRVAGLARHPSSSRRKQGCTSGRRLCTGPHHHGVSSRWRRALQRLGLVVVHLTLAHGNAGTPWARLHLAPARCGHDPPTPGRPRVAPREQWRPCCSRDGSSRRYGATGLRPRLQKIALALPPSSQISSARAFSATAGPARSRVRPAADGAGFEPGPAEDAASTPARLRLTRAVLSTRSIAAGEPLSYSSPSRGGSGGHAASRPPCVSAPVAFTPSRSRTARRTVQTRRCCCVSPPAPVLALVATSGRLYLRPRRLRPLAAPHCGSARAGDAAAPDRGRPLPFPLELRDHHPVRGLPVAVAMPWTRTKPIPLPSRCRCGAANGCDGAALRAAICWTTLELALFSAPQLHCWPITLDTPSPHRRPRRARTSRAGYLAAARRPRARLRRLARAARAGEAKPRTGRCWSPVLRGSAVAHHVLARRCVCARERVERTIPPASHQGASQAALDRRIPCSGGASRAARKVDVSRRSPPDPCLG